jgi:hypothetical protein
MAWCASLIMLLSTRLIGADDATLLQTMAARGGTIQLESRVYRLTRTVTIDLARSGFTAIHGGGTAVLRMEGPGPALRMLGTHEGTADPKSVKEKVWQRERSPLIEGLEIIGAHPEASGVEAQGTMQLMLSQLTIRQCQHAIHLVKRNRNIIISNCHLYENRGIGIYYDSVNLHQSNIVGCHVSYNKGGGIVVKGGDVRNIHIGTCDLEGNQDESGPPTANVLFDCTGGQMGEVAITGCTIQHGRTAPNAANIRMIGRSTIRRASTSEMREGHIAITGNVLSDIAVNVELRHVRGVVVTGNTFWQSFAHNLLVEDSTHVNVSGNIFDRNPRYDDRDAAKENTGVVFRRCDGCTITGMHLAGFRKSDHQSAALLLSQCRRMNVSGLTVLDCDGVGLRLEKCEYCRVASCLIHDDRKPPGMTSAIVDRDGTSNHIEDLKSP